MAWSYGEDLDGQPRDLVRHLIGDVTQTRFSPSDSEIDYWLGVHTDVTGVDAYGAAAEVARVMANRFSTLAATSVQIGGMKMDTDFTGASARYTRLAEELLAGRVDTDRGGVRTADVSRNRFSMGMMDNPYA